MLKKLLRAAFATAVMVLAMPSQVDAYGAVHAGATHVGPNGVYHTSDTVAAGPRGVVATSHTTAVPAGGGVYRAGSAAGYGPNGAAAYGTGTTGYRSSTYNSNAAAAAANGAYR